jgi:hypothetical protein
MKPAELEYLCLEELPNNCFLVIRVDVPGPMEKMAAASELARGLAKYSHIINEKKATVMVMTPKEGLSVLTEEEMNQAGWIRKQKNE